MQPRPLRPEERAALLAVINHADFEGREAVVEQVDAARVVGHCGCGCATVDLDVDRSAPPASPRGPLETEGTVVDDDGKAIGGVLVFVEDGYLSSLEVYSFADEPIHPFPPVERLRLR